MKSTGVNEDSAEHATKERDRFIAHALKALSQSAPEAPDTPIVTADDQGDGARLRTQQARRPSDEEDALSEIPSDEDFSAVRVRPSGFEPETCGLRVRCRGVRGMPVGPLTCGYVQDSSTK